MQFRTAFEISCLADILLDFLVETKLINLSALAQKLSQMMNFEEFTNPDCNIEAYFEIMASLQEMGNCLNKSINLDQTKEYLTTIKEAALQKCKPLKVAFIVHEFSLWPSFQTIWESCPNDIDKSLVVVYGLGRPLTDKELDVYAEPYRQAGYTVRTANNYNMELEQPDIIFYMKPYRGFRSCPEEFYINNIKKVTPYSVFVSYCLDVQGGELLQEYFYGQPFFYHVWRIIGYSKYYQSKMIERGYRNADNVVLLGHPKFDISYKLGKEKRFVNDVWKQKINGRKVVLWNSHFTIEPGIGVGTFLRWRNLIFNYFLNHKDIVLLWRPHPIFWQSIKQTKEIDIKELNDFLHQIEDQDNIIIDKTADYRFAFCMSDALISDAATFLVEYAATSNPILYTVKPDGEKVCNPDYLIGVQTADKKQDIVSFLDNVRLNRIDADVIKTNHNMFEKIFGSCDGLIGQRIINYVVDEMKKDIYEKANKRIKILGQEQKDAME